MSIIKTAGLEESSFTDPRTGLVIRISTTVRIKYRKYYRRGTQDVVNYNEFGSKSDSSEDSMHFTNTELNDIIAQDFARSSDGAKHMFVANTSNISSRKREWVEVRSVTPNRPFNIFFSVIRPEHIDIINISTRWIKPRRNRTPIKNTSES